MDGRPPAPRTVALANLAAPGVGYLLAGRRVLLGGILVGFTMITAALAVLFLSILFEHFPHVHPDGYPAIVGAVVLFALQYAAIAVGTAVDGYNEGQRALAEAAARDARAPHAGANA